jgi:hypothetical protein
MHPETHPPMPALQMVVGGEHIASEVQPPGDALQWPVLLSHVEGGEH